MAQKFVVNVSVADLRQEPTHFPPQDYKHQPLRNSQLLYGENLSLLEEKGEWIKVEASEQPHFTEAKGWHLYEGWITKKEVLPVSSFPVTNKVVVSSSTTVFPFDLTLVFGTYVYADDFGNLELSDGRKGYCSPGHLRPLPKHLNRKLLVEDAKRFLKLPYLWGGRSFQIPESVSSVDCSGLINLIFRAQGKIIPRDAHPQYLASAKIENLQVGDLVYLSEEKKISHVLLKVEGPYFLDASKTEGQVRYLRFGQDIKEKNGKYYLKNQKSAFSVFFRSFV